MWRPGSGSGRGTQKAARPSLRFDSWLPAILSAAAAIAFFYRSVLIPGRFPGIHDLVFFHLPLRTEFARLAKSGLPLWNQTIHGGQPILANPNYGAFYPPSWIFLLVEPVSALKVLVLLHAIWGFAGAWRFAADLGCRRSAAALAAVGFVGSGAMASSVGTLSPFFSLAWFPWILNWGLRALEVGKGGRSRPVALAAVGLALQLVAGEPTVAFLTAIALFTLAGLDRAGRLRKSTVVLVILVASVGVAAIQLLPTFHQVSETSSAGATEGRGALVWSTAPERLVEIVFPRVHGEPTLAPRGLYFGSGVHDKTYPYFLSIYPGQVVLALAFVGLLMGGTRRRLAWTILLAAGFFLAAGRHNPFYAGVLAHLPPFQWIRYPEKFLLLTTAALPFVAALAWERLLERRAEHSGPFRLALATALLFVATNLILAALLGLLPAVAADFVQNRTPEIRSAEELAAGVAFIGRGALLQLAVALLFLLVIVLYRKRGSGWAVAILPLLAAGDLALANRWVNPTVAVESFLHPPAAARELIGRGERIATDQGFFLDQRSRPFTTAESDGAPWIRQGVELLDPFVGTLWGLSYALNPDYDLMATPWATRALELFYTTAAGNRSRLAPLLGAWAVETFVVRRPPTENDEGSSSDPREPPIEMLGIEDPLARVRFVPEAAFFESLEAAQADVALRAFDVGALESLFDPEASDRRVSFDSGAVVHRAAPNASGVEIVYEAAGPALLVLATTYDAGWRASVKGSAVPVLATALGQTAIPLPAGKETVVLEFRQPWLGVGAIVSLVTLVLLVVAVRVSGSSSERWILRGSGRMVRAADYEKESSDE